MGRRQKPKFAVCADERQRGGRGRRLEKRNRGQKGKKESRLDPVAARWTKRGGSWRNVRGVREERKKKKRKTLEPEVRTTKCVKGRKEKGDRGAQGGLAEGKVKFESFPASKKHIIRGTFYQMWKKKTFLGLGGRLLGAQGEEIYSERVKSQRCLGGG